MKIGGEGKCWGTLNEQTKMNEPANGLGEKKSNQPKPFLISAVENAVLHFLCPSHWEITILHRCGRTGKL